MRLDNFREINISKEHFESIVYHLYSKFGEEKTHTLCDELVDLLRTEKMNFNDAKALLIFAYSSLMPLEKKL